MIRVTTGTIVNATVIHTTSSTKNRSGSAEQKALEAFALKDPAPGHSVLAAVRQ